MHLCVTSHRLPTNSSNLTSTRESPHPSDPNLRDPRPILGRATIRAGYALVSEKDHSIQPIGALVAWMSLSFNTPWQRGFIMERATKT